jgi:hypothetical protein
MIACRLTLLGARITGPPGGWPPGALSGADTGEGGALPAQVPRPGRRGAGNNGPVSTAQRPVL